MFRFALPVQLHGLCNGRTLDRHDVASGALGSLDTGWFAEFANDRARDVCASELSNVVALDLA
jgi:hypothetical protein